MATIKAGTYRFNDVLTQSFVPSGNEGEIAQSINYTITHEDQTQACDKITVYVESDTTISYAIHTNGDDGMCVYYGTDGWLYGGIGQTITIPEDTDVSDEFEPWFTANTKRLSTVSYNGSIIASLLGGQTATLKCAGMTMESDVVVDVAELPEGGGSDANIVPLTVTENGTFDENYIEIVTEVFESGREPNAIYDYFGMYQLPYIKANKLVANGIMNAIDEGKVSYNIGGEIYTVTSDGIRTNADKKFVAVDYQTMMPMVLWVITPDDTYYTTEAGFESNSVYVLDGWSAGMLGEDVTAAVTALGISDKKVDGYMPVQVQLPIIDELIVEPDFGSRTFTGDGYYRKVKVKGMSSMVYTITPSTEKQVIRQSDLRSDQYIAQVTVNPMDLSDLSNKKVLCGIYLDPLPKTEYKVGEWLDESGSVIVRQYTNGETEHVSLTLDCVFGFSEIARVPGTHKLTVKVTEGGITSQTVFWVTITE